MEPGTIPALLTGWFGPLIVAPAVGSFLGVVIRRLPDTRSVLLGRSACEHCGSVLRARDLVPVASFLLLRGKCRDCGTRIAWFHPLVELAATGIAVIAVIGGIELHEIWSGCVLGWILLALSWIDWDRFILPDMLTLPLLLAGLLATLAWDPGAVAEHTLAAAVAYVAFKAVALGYRHLRQREGLGGGDAKLIAAGGAWLGIAALPWVVWLAACTGLLGALWMMVAGRRVHTATAVPFGPCLALGIWLVWLFGGRLGVT